MAKIGTLQINVLANTGTLEAGMARAQASVNAGSAAMTRSLTSMADRAARDAAKMARDLASVGDSFGPSTKAFETNLKQMEGNFRASMAKIKEIANVAVAMPGIDPTSFDLGSNAMRAQAAEAQRYAMALELVQKELEATAAANDNAARAYGIELSAAQAATAEARARAQGIAAQADQLDELAAKLRSSAEGQKLFAGGQKVVTEQSGAMRAGMQQLAYQLGDISTGLATGQKPMMIFAQQISQVTGALSLMTSSSKGVIGFLGGPWGMIMTAAVVALVPLISNMEIFNDKVGDAVKGLRDKAAADDIARQAQAQYEATIPGLIERENKLTEAIRDQIKARKDLAAANRFNAENLMGSSQRKVEAARQRLTAAQGESRIAAGMMTDPTSGVDPSGAAAAMNAANARAEAARKELADAQTVFLNAQTDLQAAILQDVKTGSLGSATAAGRAQKAYDRTVASLDDRASKGLISQGEYDASLRAAESRLNAAKDAAKKKSKTATSDPANDADYRFGQTMADLNERIIRARQQLATSAEDEAREAIARIQTEGTARMNAITKQADDALAKAAKIKDAKKRAAETTEIKALESTALLRNAEAVIAESQVQLAKQQQQAASDAYNLQRAANDNQRDLLQAQAQLAVTTKDRRAIQLKLLELERKEEEARLAYTIANSTNANEVKAARDRQAALPGIYAARRTGVENSTMSPWEAYLKQMKDATAATDEAFQNIAINGIQSFNDGLAQAIVNAKSLGDMLSNVAKQALADFIRLGLQMAETKLLASSRSSGGGLLSGLRSLFGGGQSAYTVVANSIPDIVSAADYLPAFADGTNSAPSGLALVGERGPEIVRFRGGEKVVPNDHLRLAGSGGNTYHVSGNVLTPEFFQLLDDNKVEAAQAGSSAALDQLARQSRRSLG